MFPGEAWLLYKHSPTLCWLNQVHNGARHGAHFPGLKLQNVPLSPVSLTSQRMLRTVLFPLCCPCPQACIFSQDHIPTLGQPKCWAPGSLRAQMMGCSRVGGRSGFPFPITHPAHVIAGSDAHSPCGLTVDGWRLCPYGMTRVSLKEGGEGP